MVKNIPLLVSPTSFVWSGISVSTTPEENDTKSITKNAGNTRGSNTSAQPIFNNFSEKSCFCSLGKVSFIFNKINIEKRAKAEEVKNMKFMEVQPTK